RGQRQNTRSKGIIERTQMRIDAAAARYRVARSALASLASTLGNIGWDTVYPALESADIRSLNQAQPNVRKGPHGLPAQRDFEISWIWTKIGDLSQQNVLLQEDLRIEWCKSKARADRWHEEIRLILAEMSRIKLFFLAMADQWAARTGVQICTGSYDDVATAAGRDAYAASQAAMYRSMSSYCASIWRHVPDFVALGYGRVIPIEIQSYEDGINEVEEVGTIDGTEDTM
ncbi:hypothetical protein H0H92_014985, partial [Tricholoma furcatifolium]